MTSTPPPHGHGTAAPNSYANVWIYGLGGSFIASVSLWQLLSGTGDTQQLSGILLLLLSALCFPLAMYSLIIRLTWTGESIAVLVGPIRREVSLTALVRVGYRRSGRTVLYVLQDQAGREVRIDGNLFAPDDEWKALILDAADRAGAEVDPKARVSLTRFDGSGRAYFA